MSEDAIYNFIRDNLSISLNVDKTNEQDRITVKLSLSGNEISRDYIDIDKVRVEGKNW